MSEKKATLKSLTCNVLATPTSSSGLTNQIFMKIFVDGKTDETVPATGYHEMDLKANKIWDLNISKKYNSSFIVHVWVTESGKNYLIGTFGVTNGNQATADVNTQSPTYMAGYKSNYALDFSLA